MMKPEYIEEAKATVLKEWEDAGAAVIEAAGQAVPFGAGMEAFLTHCTACGGNWGGMLLTGIQKLYPEVWEAIPENMGRRAWVTICSVLMLVGVDTTE